MSPVDAHDERRQWRRVRFNALVQYRFDAFDDFACEYAPEISEGGMFIRSDDEHAEGALVSLQLHLMDGTKRIEGVGRVVRNVSGQAPDRGFAVEFVNFDRDALECIRTLVRERQAEIEATEDLEQLTEDLERLGRELTDDV